MGQKLIGRLMGLGNFEGGGSGGNFDAVDGGEEGRWVEGLIL